MTNYKWALAEYGRQGMSEADCLVYAYYMTGHSADDQPIKFARWLVAEHDLGHVLKRVSAGHYRYRGYVVRHSSNLGWEAIDDDGSAFGHARTLHGTCAMVDVELDGQEVK